MKCPICNGELDRSKPNVSKCIFSNRELVRYSCVECKSLIGPEYMYSYSEEQLGGLYRELYSHYSESPNPNLEAECYRRFNPKLEQRFVNYGCGKNHKLGHFFNIDGYDKFVNCKVLRPFYDGCFSVDVIEHFTDIGRSWSEVFSLSKFQIHATPCLSVGDDFTYLFTQYHTVWYSLKALEFIASVNGFKVVKVDKLFDCYFIEFVNIGSIGLD